MKALSSATRNYVLQHPDRQKAIDERKKDRDRRRNTSAIGASNRDNDEQGKLITAVVNTQRNAAAIGSVVYPQNGSSRNRSTASLNRNTPPSQVSTNGSSEASVLTFDHLGNIVE